MGQLSLSGTKKLSIALPLVLLLAVCLSGVFLVRFLERIGMEALRDRSKSVLKVMTTGIENELRSSQSAAGAMAGSPWILPALLDPNSVNLENANSVLDRYNTNLDFSVCYLLDLQGNAVASSNRAAPDSFVGKNYAFRSYFQEALQGKATILMATGITSQERGFYAASPVCDGQGKILGVIAIKKNVIAAENVLAGYPNSFFISPEGVIFMSGSKDMIFKTLWPLSEDQIRRLKESRQFKMNSFESIFPFPIQDGAKIRFRGDLCQSFRRPLGPAGWSLVLLEPLRSVFHFVILGWIITGCVAGIVLGFILWAFGRVREQELLNKSEAKYRGLFENSRDAIMMLQAPSWKFVAGNPATIAMFRAKDESEFTSLGPWDLSPERQPDGSLSVQKAKEMIETALRQGFHYFEWTHKRINGEEFPATVLLTPMQLGPHVVIQATVRDITREKKVEGELRRKIGELERFNRIAVGRELKMIELKGKLKGLEKSGEAL